MCRAIEIIYLMCELQSSVVHVDHAARVFREASLDFHSLKDRVQNQLLFETYMHVRKPAAKLQCQGFAAAQHSRA